MTLTRKKNTKSTNQACRLIKQTVAAQRSYQGGHRVGSHVMAEVQENHGQDHTDGKDKKTLLLLTMHSLFLCIGEFQKQATCIHVTSWSERAGLISVCYCILSYITCSFIHVSLSKIGFISHLPRIY